MPESSSADRYKMLHEMPQIIRPPVVLRSDEIELATRAGNHIENIQPRELGNLARNELAAFAEHARAIGGIVRSKASPAYNCHGFTFACRRTELGPDDVDTVLHEDRYERLGEESQALPGDVLIYRANNGDIPHSAIVVGAPADDDYGRPRVVSKWGQMGEVIHFPNNVPVEYQNCTHEYYRVNS